MALYSVTLDDDSSLAIEADSAWLEYGALLLYRLGIPIRGFAPGQWLRFEVEPQEPAPKAPDPYTQATLQSVCG